MKFKGHKITIGLFIKRLLFLCILQFAFSTQAQVYPIEVYTNVLPPYPLNLASYAEVGYNRIHVSVRNLDLNQPEYNFKLRLVIEGPGGLKITTTPDALNLEPVYTVGGGQTILLKTIDLAHLFLPENLVLPSADFNELSEGFYRFHFEAVDVNRGNVVSNPYAGYQSAWLAKLEPPRLLAPENEATITPTLAPITADGSDLSGLTYNEPVTFIWAPRGIPPVNASVTYRVHVYQLNAALNGNQNFTQSPADAVASGSYINSWEFETNMTSLYANSSTLTMLELEKGSWYAWQIEAVDLLAEQSGEPSQVPYRNAGFTEIYSFYYGDECEAPADFDVLPTNNGPQLIFSSTYTDYDIELQYREAGKIFSSWSTQSPVTPYQVLNELNPGVKYEFKLRTNCGSNFSDFTNTVKLETLEEGESLCKAPTQYSARRVIVDDKEYIRVSWTAIPDAQRYEVSVSNDSKVLTYRTTETSYDFTSGLDGIVGDIVQITIGVQCQGESNFLYGGPWTADLSRNAYSGGECTAPENEQLTATYYPTKITEVQWEHDVRYSNYTMQWRPLGTDIDFLVTSTINPPASLEGCIPGVDYEAYINYSCADGGTVMGDQLIFTPVESESEFVATGACYPPSGLRHFVPELTKLQILWELEDGIDDYEVQWRVKPASEDEFVAWKTVRVSDNEAMLTRLTAATTYEIQVRSLCGEGRGFSQWSRIYEATTDAISTKGDECPQPVDNAAVTVSITEISVNPDRNDLYTGYFAQYRVYGDNIWTDVAPSDIVRGTIALKNLAENTNYEYRLQAYCGALTSEFSPFDTIRTPIEQHFESDVTCGTQSSFNVGGSTAKTLTAGDKFMAMGWELTIREVTPSGEAYNGTAYATVPYLKNSTVEFKLENIKVNQKGNMFAGQAVMQKIVLRLISEELAAKINAIEDKIAQGLEYADEVLEKIDAVLATADQFKEVLETPDLTVEPYVSMTPMQKLEEGYKLASEAVPMMQSNDPSVQLEGAKQARLAAALIAQAISEGAKDLTAQNSDATLAECVRFYADANQLYGFDDYQTYHHQVLENQYTYIELADDNKFFIPFKSVGKNLQDVVWVELPTADAAWNTYRFEAGSTVLSPTETKTANGKPWGKLTVPGSEGKIKAYRIDTDPSDATKTIDVLVGQLNIERYKPDEYTIRIVRVGNDNKSASLLALPSEIEEKLNEVYKQAAVSFTVEQAPNVLQVEGFETGGWEVADENMLYAPNMELVIDAYTEDIPKNTFVMFVVDRGSEGGTLDGYMPLQYDMGFIFNDQTTEADYGHTFAHEIGHGVFGLRHTFSPFNEYLLTENSTQSLMDYTGGEELFKYQWDKIDNPSWLVFVRGGDEGAITNPVDIIPLTYLAKLSNNQKNGLTTGNCTLDITKDCYLNYFIGSLASMNNEIAFIVRYPKDKTMKFNGKCGLTFKLNSLIEKSTKDKKDILYEKVINQENFSADYFNFNTYKYEMVLCNITEGYNHCIASVELNDDVKVNKEIHVLDNSLLENIKDLNAYENQDATLRKLANEIHEISWKLGRIENGETVTEKDENGKEITLTKENLEIQLNTKKTAFQKFTCSIKYNCRYVENERTENKVLKGDVYLKIYSKSNELLFSKKIEANWSSKMFNGTSSWDGKINVGDNAGKYPTDQSSFTISVGNKYGVYKNIVVTPKSELHDLRVSYLSLIEDRPNLTHGTYSILGKPTLPDFPTMVTFYKKGVKADGYDKYLNYIQETTVDPVSYMKKYLIDSYSWTLFGKTMPFSTNIYFYYLLKVAESNMTSTDYDNISDISNSIRFQDPVLTYKNHCLGFAIDFEPYKNPFLNNHSLNYLVWLFTGESIYNNPFHKTQLVDSENPDIIVYESTIDMFKDINSEFLNISKQIAIKDGVTSAEVKSKVQLRVGFMSDIDINIKCTECIHLSDIQTSTYTNNFNDIISELNTSFTSINQNQMNELVAEKILEVGAMKTRLENFKSYFNDKLKKALFFDVTYSNDCGIIENYLTTFINTTTQAITSFAEYQTLLETSYSNPNFTMSAPTISNSLGLYTKFEQAVNTLAYYKETEPSVFKGTFEDLESKLITGLKKPQEYYRTYGCDILKDGFFSFKPSFVKAMLNSNYDTKYMSWGGAYDKSKDGMHFELRRSTPSSGADISNGQSKLYNEYNLDQLIVKLNAIMSNNSKYVEVKWHDETKKDYIIIVKDKKP